MLAEIWSIFSRVWVEFWPKFGRSLAEISRDFASKTREFFDKIKVAERTRKKPPKKARIFRPFRILKNPWKRRGKTLKKGIP